MKRALLLLTFTAGCAMAPVRMIGRPVDPLLAPMSGSADLKMLTGKVTVVSVWASWCRRCSQSLPSLVSLQNKLGSQGLAVVTIDVDADQRAADAFLRDLSLDGKLTLLRDPGARDVERHFDINQLPATYVVNRQGRIVQEEQGYDASTPERIQRAVMDLLAPPGS